MSILATLSRKTSGLRFRLLLLMVVAMSPLFLFVLLSANQGRETIAQEYQDEQFRLTQVIADHIRQHLEASDQLLFTLAQIPSIRAADLPVCNDILSHLLEQYPGYTNLWSVDLNGDSRCSALSVEPGSINIADQPWFQEALHTKSVTVGAYQPGPLTGLPIIPMAAPVFDSAGELAGVVGVGLSIDWLNAFIDSLAMPAGSRLTLLDGNGVVLAVYPEDDALLGVSASASPLFQDIIGHDKGVVRGALLTEVERLFGFERIGSGSGAMYVVLGIPQEVAYSELSRGITNAIYLLVGVTLLAMAIAWVTGHLLLLRPIKQLAEATERLGRGDLTARVASRRSVGELYTLAENFNQMAAQLERSHEKLAATNRDLAREIDERKQAEDGLKKFAAQLESSNQELEQFAYVASHDLQEPLRVVAGYLQLIERRYKGRLDSDADEFIAFAVDAAKRMQALINDLLAYSRIGRKIRPFEPTDGNDVLKQALFNLSVLLNDEQVTVTNDPLPTVMADGAQLVSVFQNLISNAVKFKGDAPPRIHVGAVDCGEEWKLSVSDNGIGIDPQYTERIFLIFQRLHTREEYPGTGIGLAICQKIIDYHGGRIWVEPNDGPGATFYFTLPKLKKEPSS